MAKREMPIWPTYVQGIVVVGVTGFGGYWLRHHAAMEVPAAIGISLIVGLIVGVAALYIAEWF